MHLSQRDVKRAFFRSFFALEVVFFFWLYFLGAQGMNVLWQLDRDNALLDQELYNLQQNIDRLEHDIVAWRNDPFYQEKVAREHLHMARKDDQIFYR